ncbi:CCC motif membrane protein [Chryseobacterium sp.]|uniref:CCC motif membrane protein n=1 Tax=Chryseobacterium sp. TaxID=1871047 RepID=UPI00388D6C51
MEGNFQSGTVQKLPNATAVLILGIISILGCCCYGLPGLIAGIIGLILSKKDNQLYKNNPSMYSGYDNLKAGKIMSIIGIALSILFIIYLIVVISIFGLETLSDPDLMQEKLRELQNR